MQNETPPAATPPKQFLGLLVTGALLLGVGIVFLQQLNRAATERSWIGHTFGSLIFFSPVMLVLGAVMVLVGVFRYVSRFVKFSSIISAKWAARLGLAWRIFICVVAGLTIFPWWWLDILTRMNGERPGNEGEGMGGFLITLFVGLPCVALAIFSEVFFRSKNGKKP